MKKFSISEVISEGWNIFKNNLQIILMALGLTILVSIVGGAVAGVFVRSDNGSLQALGALINLIFGLGQMVLSIGLLKITIMLVSGQKPDISEMWKNYPLFLSYFVMSIVMGIVVLLGLILLVIPGIYLAIRLQLAPYFLVDKKMGPIDALRASWAATKGNSLSLFGADLVFGLLNFLGLVLLLIGILVTGPVTMIAMATIYRKLAINNQQ